MYGVEKWYVIQELLILRTINVAHLNPVQRSGFMIERCIG